MLKSQKEQINIIQWINTKTIINRFNNINNKENCYFPQFHIKYFYTSMKGNILNKALNLYMPVPNDIRKLSRTSIL